MQRILKENEQFQNKIDVLNVEIGKRESIILNIRDDQAALEEKLLAYHEKEELQGDLEQRKEEMRLMFAEKEAEVKDKFAKKVNIPCINSN